METDFQIIEVSPDFKDGPKTANTTVIKTDRIASSQLCKAHHRRMPVPALCPVRLRVRAQILPWLVRPPRGHPFRYYDIDDNLDSLVNAVFQLTTHMVTYQLGHERSACLLERPSYYQIEHVSFLVSMGADGDPHLWKTGSSHMVLFVFTNTVALQLRSEPYQLGMRRNLLS